MTIETANRLYELRKKQGLSQEELAEKLGVSRQAVSKWERSEASPDTDNLIALAKIYGLSLDELIYGAKDGESVNKEESSEENEATEDFDKVEIGPTCIHVESKEGDKVKINLNGIQVESDNGEKIKIGPNGINIKCSDDDDDDDDDYEDDISDKRGAKFWLEIPYPIICSIAYLLFGFCNICGGWALSWIIFITVPIYYSFVEAIYKRRFSEFAYPVLTIFLYLFIGLYLGNWHPSWLIVLTVPIYYSIANALDKAIKNRKNNVE